MSIPASFTKGKKKAFLSADDTGLPARKKAEKEKKKQFYELKGFKENPLHTYNIGKKERIPAMFQEKIVFFLKQSVLTDQKALFSSGKLTEGPP